MPPLPLSCRYSGAPACRSAPVPRGGRGLATGGRPPAVGSFRVRFALCDLVISGVDPRNSGGRERDAFGRQPLRDHEIGMTFAHQTMVGLANYAGGDARRHTEDCIRVFEGVLSRGDVESPNAGIIR